MWDSWCGFPHPCSAEPASSPSLLSFSWAWQAFSNAYHMPQAGGQPTCLRKTDLLFPATPWPLRMITRCQETSAITVWKIDACQVSRGTGFPCHVLSQHGPCCRCCGPTPALHLPGRALGPVGAVAWPGAEDAPLACDPARYPFTPPETWYRRENDPCSWHGRILFP